ncbi:GIY-YIG domain-containing protein [Vibrio cholerae]|uniref:GIY-YIG domain-containing protein n=1 Tax=Vibrio cholerae TaxID=666 RepID=UPI00301DE46C
MNFDVISQGVNPDKALIYMWEIYDKTDVLVGRYVGKAKNGAKRPLKHYKRNVARLIAGKPYRKSNPNSYRVVHKALADAVDKNYVIKLYFLANINEGEDINQVEQTLINQHDCKGSESWQLNG